MVRAAAKNHPSVAVVTDPWRSPGAVLESVRGGGFTLEQRKRLAAEAFVHTATYDAAVASWMGSVLTDTSDGTGFPAWVGGTWDKAAVLRYGENPHQRAALYTNGFQPQPDSRRPPNCTARRCPTTTTSMRMPRCAPPTTTGTSPPSR